MEIGNRGSRLRRTDVAAFAVLLALTVTLPALYVSAERVVYSSDYAGFQDSAVNTALELRERLASGVHATLGLAALVWRSTGWDYSLFPAVLPAPVMLALHGGRVAYIVTCAVLYLLPFVLLLGTTAAMLVPNRRRAAFWTGVAVAASPRRSGCRHCAVTPMRGRPRSWLWRSWSFFATCASSDEVPLPLSVCHSQSPFSSVVTSPTRHFRSWASLARPHC